MDTVNNISLPAGLSLNSAVSIIPTSPHKVSKQLPNTARNVANVASKSLYKVPNSILTHDVPLGKFYLD